MPTDDYGPDSIVVLRGLEAVRRRPGMYIGDVEDGSGLLHLIWEVVGNSIDEHLARHASLVRVNIDGDTVSVEDDGRGIPIDPLPREGNRSCLEVLFTTLRAGTDKQPHVHLSTNLHGVGIAPVNALSERLVVETVRGGHLHTMEFTRGTAVGGLRDLGPTARRGTRITFTPDFTIFTRRSWDLVVIRERLHELAAFNPGLTVELQGESLRAPTGLADLVREHARDRIPLHSAPIRVTGTDSDVVVEVALQWCEGTGVALVGYASQARAPLGTHIAGFWRGLRRALADLAEDRVRGLDTDVFRDAIGAGMVACVHAALYHPPSEIRDAIACSTPRSRPPFRP